MHIFSYNVTIEDLAELSLNRTRFNPAMRLQSNILHFVIPVLIFLASIGTVYLLDADKQLQLVDWVVPCVLVVLMLFLFPRTFEKNLRKRITEQMKQGDEKDLVGRYTTKLLPEVVVQTFKGKEIRVPWTAISQITVTRDHIFLLIDESQAILIPCKGLPSPEHFELARGLVAQFQKKK